MPGTLVKQSGFALVKSKIVTHSSSQDLLKIFLNYLTYDNNEVPTLSFYIYIGPVALSLDIG